MSEQEVRFKHQRFEDLDKSDNRKASGPEEINSGFYTAFKSNRRRNGHPAVFREGDNAVEESATASLALRWGEEMSQVEATEVEVAAGDIYTISSPAEKLRIKFYGTVYSRPENENILNDLQVNYSLDKWNSRNEVWAEVQRLGATNNGVVEEEVGESTLRVYLSDAPGLNPEKDFRRLIQNGLSPAEALDYWMVEMRKETQSNWADVRDRSQQAISKNIQAAKDELSDS